MKVAVISNQSNQGLSSFCVLLATTFAKTQARKSVILSTGSMRPMLDQVDIREKSTPENSVSVYNAMIEARSIRGEELYCYATRIGEAGAYAFDIFSTIGQDESLENLFFTTLKEVTAELIIVEVVGDINSDINKKVLEQCDAVLYMFNANRTSIEKAKEYRDNYNRTVVIKTGYICNKYDRNAVDEKRIAAAIGISMRNLMQVPYCPAIISASFSHELDSLARHIAKGSSPVMELRPKLLEVMQFLFDSGTLKYIKGVDKWHK